MLIILYFVNVGRAAIVLDCVNLQYGKLKLYDAGYCEIMMDDGVYADLMTYISGLEKDKFDLYYEMATVDKFDNYTIRFLHYNHLLQNKEAIGRAKEKLDIVELRRINDPDQYR